MLLAAMKTAETRLAFLAVLLFSLATIVLLGPAETRQLESVQLQATAQLIAGGFAAARDQQAPVLITLNRAAPTGTLSIENGM